ncbi:MAG TPA: hypothetical protein VF713_25370 [Thermoanaerobaculia bacterium]
MSFVYHANALAFGGVNNKPCCDVIPSQASVVLAPSGGEGSQTVRNFNYKGIITFDEASVYVGGSQKGCFRNTVSTAMIRNLNLMNVVHIELLCVRVTSEHAAVDDKLQSACGEPAFTFEGSIIENIRIAGRRVNVALDTSVFSRYPTHSEFVEAFGSEAVEEDRLLGVETTQSVASQGRLSARYGKRFCWPSDRCRDGAPSKNGVIRASLVDDIDIPDTDEDFGDEDNRRKIDRIKPVRRNGYVVRIADFGTLAIGEVILKENQRTVNMLRYTLGSPNDGSGTVCSGTTNGTDMFP